MNRKIVILIIVAQAIVIFILAVFSLIKDTEARRMEKAAAQLAECERRK